MAKNQFEKFRESTLSQAGLGDVLNNTPSHRNESVSQAPSVQPPVKAAEWGSRNEGYKQVSGYIRNETYTRLNRLRFERSVSFKELLSEAFEDLLNKYNA